MSNTHTSLRVRLVDVVVTDWFFACFPLSSVAELRFLGRVFKLVSQVEEPCLIEKNNTPPHPFSSYILDKIYMDKIKSFKFRHFKEN